MNAVFVGSNELVEKCGRAVLKKRIINNYPAKSPDT